MIVITPFYPPTNPRISYLKKWLFIKLYCEGVRRNTKEKKDCKKEEEIDC
jgi:hypothetical protein